jgi:N-acetylmuramoyl-L-alanine amidase
MKIGIDCGHTLSGNDTGAEGNGRKEQECTREVGSRVIAKLQSLGHEVTKCYKDTCTSLDDSLSYRTTTANNNNVDLYVSIHLNAGGGYGTEVFTYGAKELPETRNILNNFVDLGFKNRGIKDGSGLYVIRNTHMKSMLVENCFIDTNDMNRYDPEAFANAIVKGIIGKVVPQMTVPDKQFKIDMIANIQDTGIVNVSGINDCTVGTVGQSKRIEALSINISDVDINYDVHIQDVGDIKGQIEGQAEGTIGQSKRLEAITINVKSIPEGHKLQYQSQIEGIGWQEWKESGQLSGTEGKSLRLETLRIKIIKL